MYTPSNNFLFSSVSYTPSNNFTFTYFVSNDAILTYTLSSITANFNIEYIPSSCNTYLNYTLTGITSNINCVISNDSHFNCILANSIPSFNTEILSFNACNINVVLDGIVNVQQGNSTDINQYTLCSSEGGTVVFDEFVDVAYGAAGHYIFLYNVIGSIHFYPAQYGGDSRFYGDPAVGVLKSGYYRNHIGIINCDISSDFNLSYTLDSITSNITVNNFSPNLFSLNHSLFDITHNVNSVISNDSSLNYLLENIISNINLEIIPYNGFSLNYSLGELTTNVNSVISNDSSLNYLLENVIPNIHIDLGNTVHLNYTLESIISNINVNVNLTTNINSVLEDIVVSINCFIPPRVEFELSGYTGNSATVNIRNPNKAIFNCLGATGNYASVTYPNDILIYDLELDSCCYDGGKRPYRNETWNIELARADQYDAIFSRTKLKVSIDLMTRPRMEFKAFTGNSLTEDPRMFYLSTSDNPIKAYRGNFGTVEFQDDDRLRLCKGNFIPDSESVDFELADVLLEDCGVIIGYTGNSGKTSISSSIKMNSIAFSGNVLTVDLITYPYIPPVIPTYNAYTGNSGIVESIHTSSTISSQGYTGNSAFIQGYKEITYNAYRGNNGTVIIEENIGVEILDSGDLENEYRYIDENGDEIKSKFTPAVVETYPYQHFIKAACKLL